MNLIEQDELAGFRDVLRRFGLPEGDFGLTETDTTDPKTDEVYALTGFVVVTQKSSGRQAQYPIGDGSRWVEEFERDLASRLFSR
jgi:hypothetical protein